MEGSGGCSLAHSSSLCLTEPNRCASKKVTNLHRKFLSVRPHNLSRTEVNDSTDWSYLSCAGIINLTEILEGHTITNKGWSCVGSFNKLKLLKAF